MQTLELARLRNATVHLTTFRQLERHCHNESKHVGYERMLVDFGVDVEAFSTLVKGPRLVLAEQPGCWFYGYDLMRVRLLKALRETGIFHDSSGVLSLANDAFTCRGVKKYLVQLHFIPDLKPIPLIGTAHFRRHRNRVYSAFPISGSAYERIATILDISLSMLSSARISSATFAREVTAIFAAGVRPGARHMLPTRVDKKSLLEFGAHLRDYDLAAARQPLARARQELDDGISWMHYWDRVNSFFMDTRVGTLGPLFNRFLLAIENPVQMSRILIRLTGHPAGEPIAVAGVVVGNEKYRMIFFDPDSEKFFYFPTKHRQTITWARIREMAERDRTGGPAATLEYLMLAASGIYLIADCDDGYSRFECQAREIHQHYTGTCFPYIALPWEEGFAYMDYMQIYRPEFELNSRADLECFFA